jgi:hypothetical protein
MVCVLVIEVLFFLILICICHLLVFIVSSIVGIVLDKLISGLDDSSLVGRNL